MHYKFYIHLQIHMNMNNKENQFFDFLRITFKIKHMCVILLITLTKTPDHQNSQANYLLTQTWAELNYCSVLSQHLSSHHCCKTHSAMKKLLYFFTVDSNNTVHQNQLRTNRN